VSLVLDSSITLAWLFPDELTPAVTSVLDRVGKSGGWAPSLWWLEVANSLQMGVRRKRITAGFRDATLEDLKLLPIRLDPETAQHAWSSTLQLAVAHKLSVYDAAYLELARRLVLPLATLDEELRAAAKRMGITLLGK
jgi:predicted nucleic acid-binding protein